MSNTFVLNMSIFEFSKTSKIYTCKCLLNAFKLFFHLLQEKVREEKYVLAVTPLTR